LGIQVEFKYNEKIEHYIKMKTHKYIVLKF